MNNNNNMVINNTITTYSKKEQLFVPAYNRYGTWYFLDGITNMEGAKWWYKKNSTSIYTQDERYKYEQTTLTPFNCVWCPNFIRNLYVRYKLITRFWPKTKEF
jgi:hypothetical protein